MLTTDLISGIYPKTHKNQQQQQLGDDGTRSDKMELSLQKYVIPAALYILPHYRLDLFNESVKVGHVLAYFFSHLTKTHSLKPTHDGTESANFPGFGLQNMSFLQHFQYVTILK